MPETNLDIDSFMILKGWMVDANGLNLDGKELLCYSIIYGFTQNGKPATISLAWFISWIKSNKRNTINSLNSLLKKGLITIKKTPGKINSYCVKRQPIKDAMNHMTYIEYKSHPIPKEEEKPGKTIEDEAKQEAQQEIKKMIYKDQHNGKTEEEDNNEIRNFLNDPANDWINRGAR